MSNPKFVVDYINGLVNKYKYQKLDKSLSDYSRNLYRSNIPSWLHVVGEDQCELFSPEGVLICTGYTRIVVGDYGAYIEFSTRQANHNHFIIPQSQMYRLEDKYRSGVKYLWYSTYKEDIKIYYQTRGVPYADYIPRMFYVSVFDVNPGVLITEEGDDGIYEISPE